MYYIEKKIEISAAHYLNLPYESKCTRLHGHNWLITVCCKAASLDENGMVTDFGLIKQKVQDTFDHRCLNEVMDVNPTAENIARLICDSIPRCYRVSVQESEGNTAVYESDNA